MNKAWILRAIAAGLLAHLVYTTLRSAPNPLYTIGHMLNVAAVAALSVRYSHARLRSHAMIAALCLAGAAFVFAHQSEAKYAAEP